MKDINCIPIIEEARKSKGYSWTKEVLIFCIVYSIGTLFQYCILIIPELICFWNIDETRIIMKKFKINKLLDSSYTANIINKFPSWFDAVMLFSTLGVIFAVIIYCRNYEKRSWLSLGIHNKKVAKEYIKGIIIGSLIISFAVFINYLFGAMRLNTNIIVSKIPLIILFLIGYMIQGFSEELLCRGYLLISMARQNNIMVSVVCSAIVFSLLHSFNNGVTVLSIINLFLFGIFIGMYFLKTNSIVGAAAIHTSWNFIQGNIFGVYVSGNKAKESFFETTINEKMSIYNGGEFGLEGGLIITALLIVCIVITCVLTKKGNYEE